VAATLAEVASLPALLERLRRVEVRLGLVAPDDHLDPLWDDGLSYDPALDEPSALLTSAGGLVGNTVPSLSGLAVAVPTQRQGCTSTSSTSACAQLRFPIWIRADSGPTGDFSVEVGDADTFGDVKLQILDSVGILPANQRFFCDGIELEDSRTPMSYNIGAGSTISVDRTLALKKLHDMLRCYVPQSLGVLPAPEQAVIVTEALRRADRGDTFQSIMGWTTMQGAD